MISMGVTAGAQLLGSAFGYKDKEIVHKSQVVNNDNALQGYVENMDAATIERTRTIEHVREQNNFGKAMNILSMGSGAVGTAYSMMGDTAKANIDAKIKDIGQAINGLYAGKAETT